MEIEKKGIDQAEMEAKIQELLALVNSTPDPDELENIKKLIKKNVPFTRRGYFSALLLKLLMEKKEAPRRERRERPERKDREARPEKKVRPEMKDEKKEPRKEQQQKPERILPEDARTLYLNIGKMKHLYAKNLSILLQEELGITRDDIYSLRVHDKYSFITMSEENCTRAIEKLNGRDINGRTAELNFSTK